MSSVVLNTLTRGALNQGGGTTTISVIVPSGAQALYVRIGYWINGTGLQISGVTYNAVALTRVAAGAASSVGDRSDIWRLLSPSVGTFNLVVTASTGSFGDVIIQCATSGLDTGTPEGTAVGASGTSTAPQTASTINAASADLIVDAGAGDPASAPFSPNASQTSDSNNNNGGEQAYYSHKDGDGSGTQQMAWTSGASHGWSLVAIPLKAAAGGGPTITYPEFEGRQRGVNRGVSVGVG